MAGQREEGTVVRVDHDRGFGFIARTGKKDIHFRQSDAQHAGLGELNEGDRVSFTVEDTPKGPSARNLQRLARGGGPPPQQQARVRPDTSTDFRFGPDYLRGGYFEGDDGDGPLRPEVVDS